MPPYFLTCVIKLLGGFSKALSAELAISKVIVRLPCLQQFPGNRDTASHLIRILYSLQLSFVSLAKLEVVSYASTF